MLWLGHMPYMVFSCSDIIKRLYTHYPTSIAAKTHHSIVLGTVAVLLSEDTIYGGSELILPFCFHIEWNLSMWTPWGPGEVSCIERLNVGLLYM